MKTFVSVGIGLVVGIVIGIAASFKAAEKKANQTIEEELAEERRAMREAYGISDTPEAKTGDELVKEAKENASKIIERDFCEEKEPTEASNLDEVILNTGYEPAKRPYVLDEQPEEYINNHPFINKYAELQVVYDRDRGRVCDEDGCEIFDVKGTMGWNNLNKLFTDSRFDTDIRIVCERDGLIFVAHAGDLYEYLDPDEDDRYDGD